MEYAGNLVKEEWEYTKDNFIKLVETYIKRKGISDLMYYLERSDFYTAPCSTKYHLSVKGGLCKHSINVMNALFLNIAMLNLTTYTDETIAIVSLFHDLCKIGCYKLEYKWSKDDENKWIQVPTYIYDEEFPYGHGEKSAAIVSRYLDLTPYELQAINAHMGFSDARGVQLIGNIFRKNKLAVALHFADMTATYFREE